MLGEWYRVGDVNDWKYAPYMRSYVTWEGKNKYIKVEENKDWSSRESVELPIIAGDLISSEGSEESEFNSLLNPFKTLFKVDLLPIGSYQYLISSENGSSILVEYKNRKIRVLENRIEYRNFGPLSLINRITVYEDNDTCMLEIQPAYSQIEALTNFFKKNDLPESDLVHIMKRGILGSRLFALGSPNVDQALSLLLKIGAISKLLFDEINSLSDYVYSPQSKPFIHVVPEVNVYQKFFTNKANLFSDDYYADNSILTLLGGTRFSERKLKRLLSLGVDPSVITPEGYSALHIAFGKYSEEVLALLLAYTNPYAKTQGAVFTESVIDFALKQLQGETDPIMKSQYSRKLNLIGTRLSVVEKPLSKAKVEQYKVIKNNQGGTDTFFLFNDKTIIKTVFSPACKISKNEEANVAKLFAAIFASANKNQNVEDIILADMKGNSKFIELIYDKDRLIGINLFELVTFTEGPYKGRTVIHIIYSLLHPDYRGYGLMNMLIFRPACMLQTQHPRSAIGFFYYAVSYNSYKLVDYKNNPVVHFPKYQPDILQPFIRAILEKTLGMDYKQRLKFFHDLITCFIEDDVYVKEPGKVNPSQVTQTLFYRHMLDLKSDDLAKQMRSAPIFGYIRELMESLRESANAIGINLEDFIKLSISQCEFLNIPANNDEMEEKQQDTKSPRSSL